MEPNLGFTNDLIDESPLFWPKYVRDNLIVSIIDPVSLNETKLNKFGCKADDNPILFIETLK